MSNQEFTDLLKTYKYCLKDEKTLKALLSDLFPQDVQMNSVLVNLFHLGLPQEIEKLQIISDPVFFKYKKKVVKTFGIDQKLAGEAIRMWLTCYGEQVLDRTLQISEVIPDVIEKAEKDSGKELKEKSFKNCSFKVTLPDIKIYDGVLRLKFKIMSKSGIMADVSINKVCISDKINNKYDQYFIGNCKFKEENSKLISVDIPIEKNHFMVSGSKLVLYFLSSDQRKYEIHYTRDKSTGYSLDYVIGSPLSTDEIVRLHESIKIAKSKIKTTWGATIVDDKKTGGLDPESGEAPIQIPQINEYKKALLREKYYLQKEGGHKHKVTNGILISQRNGQSTYSFEMESELHLSDDAPITLYVGASSAVGNVLVCEGFQIIIIIDKDFGPKVGQARIGIEPWKLLEALVNRLDIMGPSHVMATKLIKEGPSLATSKPASSIPKGQDRAINIARNNDITVIWGPPGTGKTYTMAQIAVENLEKGKSVLIVSHSNVSVDGVVKQTVDTIKSAGLDDYLRFGKVLRYGYVRDEVLSSDMNAVAYNYVLKHNPDLKKKMDLLYGEREQLKRTGSYHTIKGEQIEKELKKLRAGVRESEKYYASKAQLIATTISKVTVDPVFESKEYDIVMFDEVSMAYVPQIICAASYAIEKLILVGDFRQLAPIAQSEARKVLETDVFTYLGIIKDMGVCAHPWLVMLNEQRRMHPAISAFANKYIYGNLLKNHPSVLTNREDIVRREPFTGKAVNLINMSGSYCAAMKNSDNSRFNILSAIVAFTTALQAEENGENSIGIITPYAAQTRLIRAMIQDHRKSDTTEIACSTVHQFQGSERNVILFDAVENYPSSKVGWLMGKEMDSVIRLINVAVTRARGKLIVVANGRFWENKYGKTHHIFYLLMKYLMKSGYEVSAQNKELKAYMEELPFTRNLCHYNYMEDIIDDFRIDVKKAREKILISIPDGKLDVETENTIISIIMEAKGRGIRILCKTAGYKDLPEEWKKIAWASENVIFPLIIIDDEVAWYDLPKSRGLFKDGNSGFFTICPAVFRIKGEHTIEMIKTFSDLEYRTIHGERKPLLEKDGSIVDQKMGGSPHSKGDEGNASVGIDRFIRDVEKCPKCKNPMTVTRSKKGKVYLKCSSASCKEISFLTPDLINWYISKEHVTCPVHNCHIHAALGKFGVYVKCDRGHYLKPDEI